MGFLRLFLASMVLLSHMGYSVYGYNPGVMAVVVFYLLAGNVVAKLWFKAPESQRIQWFYRDRALRIFPMYYLSFLFAALLWWLLRPENYHVSVFPTAFDWFSNLTVLPLNYFMYNGTDRFTLLAPAWSLAVELQFYLLVPFLLHKRYIIYLAFLASFLVFCAAQLGYLDADIFGYRLLLGMLFVFLSGALCVNPSLIERRFLQFLWLACCFYAAVLLIKGGNPSFVFEVALGYAIGLPVVLWVQAKKRINSTTFHRLQRRAGIYSYGLFLIHFPMLWWVQPWLGTGLDAVAVVWLFSLCYAALVYRFFEKPIWEKCRPNLA